MRQESCLRLNQSTACTVVPVTGCQLEATAAASLTIYHLAPPARGHANCTENACTGPASRARVASDLPRPSGVPRSLARALGPSASSRPGAAAGPKADKPGGQVGWRRPGDTPPHLSQRDFSNYWNNALMRNQCAAQKVLLLRGLLSCSANVGCELGRPAARAPPLVQSVACAAQQARPNLMLTAIQKDGREPKGPSRGRRQARVPQLGMRSSGFKFKRAPLVCNWQSRNSK